MMQQNKAAQSNKELLSLILKQIERGQYDISQAQIEHLLDNSPFVSLFAKTHLDLFIEAILSPLVSDYDQAYDAFITNNQLSDFNQAIRLFRKFHSVVIIHQMLNLNQPFEIIAKHLSLLADYLINLALEKTYRDVKTKFNLDNIPPMTVLALGKLGARELNFSSDIDLIFLYDEKVSISFDPLRVYSGVAQQFIQYLNQLTIDGFVYRVDMRLRPFGDGSPLVSSISSFQSYCIKHAREWERYALIKARQVTTNTKEVESIISDFVYRNYMDYTVLDAIRRMKSKILKEMQIERLRFNVKLGRGGIREIEFIVQCYQLIYGGQNRHLRTPHLYDALMNLAKYQHIDQVIADKLYKHYVFLRNLENVLQMLNDQQRHHLPKKELNQNRISAMLNYSHWDALFNDYNQVSKEVQQAFDELTHFSKLDEFEKLNLEDHLGSTVITKQDSVVNLESMINDFKAKCKRNMQLSEQVCVLINELIFLFLIEVHHYPSDQQSTLLGDILKLLRAISRRSTYLYLLVESKDQLHLLVEMIARGQWFSQRLIQFPHLLETVLYLPDEHQQLYLSKVDYNYLLLKCINQVEYDAKEAFIEIVRRFKVEQVFKVAVAEYKRSLTLMETSDVLSALAEAIIETMLDYAWQQIKHKLSITENELLLLKESFCVVSYGKLGGYELGFGSDLDLIFLYKRHQKIDNPSKIYIKVVQLFVSLMQTQSYSGKLYTIDLRLRPSGETGLLVSDIQAFANYQLNQAWTWEHQAITRARWVGGSEQLQSEFELIRYDVLKRKRDLNELKKQIIAMRLKMNDNLYRPKHGYFDLKFSVGGMIDIEFLAQYMALAYTNHHQEISLFTDNIRIFQSMESAQLLQFDEAQILIEAYCYYRDLSYDYLFNNKPLLVEIDQLKPYDSKVKKIYNKWLQLTE
ncbi:bifunctional [glutamate--ammonia ligase]-adenylyl-L-tyrosine phosphorylase/[glutamate--ammonia-ligase] adenylyltransferase [Thiotrichales bacterium 19S3-7]|nr:bifunctional [glutamate--ammonia ligase]-adenylyl-L-tyrosine phosphorylase/[glutamate--ammonia-ligase] adenylyltransferase [Thiotrichales bacterium 19S3-7]MCF6802288.1 bifunctional [glutamate--ammonia ligase]-adenylyl-L-tyrosine phosphorylase/[glutamate--ammonia-ligase] adenylyltransferase [Thiotrichales bacterium 19S3-11]